MKKDNIIVLGKKNYQSRYATIYTDRLKVKPFEKFTIRGHGFTSFMKRGNPGIAILLDDRPLTGAKLKSNGYFKITLKMPPFTPGEHKISVFGIETTITVENSDEIITSGDLRKIIERDFIVDPDCHMLLSDTKYRVCPMDVLKCYLSKNDVDKKRYIAEWFDCDNYANALSGMFTYDTYPKGYAHDELWVYISGSPGHAINCFLVRDGAVTKMVIVEPQSDKIYEKWPKNWTCFVIKI